MKIRSGELDVGQKLPIQKDLRGIFKVSNDTIKGALSILVKEGYISRRQHYGTFVISSKPRVGIDLERINEISLVTCPAEKNNIPENIFAGEYSNRVIKGIEEKARENGIYLLHSTISEGKLTLTGKEKDIAGLIIDGTITPGYLRIIKKSGIPFVLTGDVEWKAGVREDVDVIAVNDFEGPYLAVKHLIQLGHRRIVYIAHSLGDSLWEKNQLNGYREALREAGIACEDNLLIETKKFKTDSGYTAMKEFLKKSIHSASAQDGESFDKLRMVSEAEPRKVEPISFTALVNMRNYFTVGIIKALSEKNLRIPEDISMVCRGGSPELTTVTYDLEELGKAAVERLIDRITNPDEEPKRIIIPYQLIIRDSTKKAE
jgi:LacI family transcriptional regulator